MTSLHWIEVARLPVVHEDPFDRLMIARTIVEGLELVTADRMISRYPDYDLKVQT